MPDIKLIAAIDNKLGIAKDAKLPWDLPSDRKYFRDHIKAGPVVMGWNMFARNKFKPFGDGDNTILTRRDTEAIPGVWVAHDAEEFFKTRKEDIWVAGGGQIYKQALSYATRLYLTRVEGDFGCDLFFPEFEQDFRLVSEEPVQTENGISFRYQIWQRK